MDILARVTIPKDSALPEDSAINTLAYSFVGTPTAGQFATLAGHIFDFYWVQVTAATDIVLNYMSEDITTGAGSAWLVEFYAITHPFTSLGSPVASVGDDSPPQVPRSTTNFPDEVAVCLSFHASQFSVSENIPGAPVGPAGDTHPRARRRGRIYVGPLNAGSGAGALGTQRPNAGVMGDFTNAAEDSLHDGPDAAGFTWSVWSRADDLLRPVTQVWVDDAFDIQRRRGIAPTTRTTVTV